MRITARGSLNTFSLIRWRIATPLSTLNSKVTRKWVLFTVYLLSSDVLTFDGKLFGNTFYKSSCFRHRRLRMDIICMRTSGAGAYIIKTSTNS